MCASRCCIVIVCCIFRKRQVRARRMAHLDGCFENRGGGESKVAVYGSLGGHRAIAPRPRLMQHTLQKIGMLTNAMRYQLYMPNGACTETGKVWQRL